MPLLFFHRYAQAYKSPAAKRFIRVATSGSIQYVQSQFLLLFHPIPLLSAGISADFSLYSHRIWFIASVMTEIHAEYEKLQLREAPRSNDTDGALKIHDADGALKIHDVRAKIVDYKFGALVHFDRAFGGNFALDQDWEGEEKAEYLENGLREECCFGQVR